MAKKIKVVQTETKTEAPAVRLPTHRYFCDACTGIAFYLFEGEALPTKATCRACGKLLTNIRVANVIKL